MEEKLQYLLKELQQHTIMIESYNITDEEKDKGHKELKDTCYRNILSLIKKKKL